MLDRSVLDAWFRGDPIDGVQFALNDPVQVKAGPHDGAHGSIITLLSLVPETAYLVELASGGDVSVAQAHLSAV